MGDRRRNVSVSSVLYFDSINLIKLIANFGIKLFICSFIKDYIRFNL
jgi:hypothetical protein